jgi:hypothetical protein
VLCILSICLLIFHLSVAICEICLLYFTYGVCLVLSLKPGMTVVEVYGQKSLEIKRVSWYAEIWIPIRCKIEFGPTFQKLESPEN